MSLTIEPLAIPEVKLVTPARFGDARGHFSETYNAQRFEDAGLPDLFVQDNQSLSGPAGTLRGLHYQTPPYAQAKLVRVLRGRILDVAVDIRAGSPSYGRHVRAELSAESGTQIYVPAGFLHGFVTLEPDTEVFYKVTAFYSRECDRGIAWDDPDLGIDWGVDPASVLLSDKDRAQPAFRSLETPFSYGGEGAGPGRGGRE